MSATLLFINNWKQDLLFHNKKRTIGKSSVEVPLSHHSLVFLANSRGAEKFLIKLLFYKKTLLFTTLNCL